METPKVPPNCDLFEQMLPIAPVYFRLFTEQTIRVHDGLNERAKRIIACCAAHYWNVEWTRRYVATCQTFTSRAEAEMVMAEEAEAKREMQSWLRWGGLKG